MSALSSTDAGCNTGLGAWRTSLGPEPGLESDPKLTGSALPHLTLPPSYFSLGVQGRPCYALLLSPPWTGLRQLPTDNRTLRVVREPSNREGVWEPRSQHVLETGWWAVGAGRGRGRGDVSADGVREHEHERAPGCALRRWGSRARPRVRRRPVKGR